MTAAAEDFIDRVLAHAGDLHRTKFNFQSWRYANRPTNEGVGLQPVEVDVDTVAACILDAEGYPANVKYVEDTEIIERRAADDVHYIQRMNLPVLGRIQVQIHLADYGEHDGWRVIAWDQDDEGTAGLDKKRGFRTEYNLGAWLLQPDAVAYALSSAPLKKDVGTLKYTLLTKGADVTASDVVRQNIDGMVAWSKRR